RDRAFHGGARSRDEKIRGVDGGDSVPSAHAALALDRRRHAERAIRGADARSVAARSAEDHGEQYGHRERRLEQLAGRGLSAAGAARAAGGSGGLKMDDKIDAMKDLTGKILPELKEAQLYRSIAALKNDVAFGRSMMIVLGLATAFLLGYIVRDQK